MGTIACVLSGAALDDQTFATVDLLIFLTALSLSAILHVCTLAILGHALREKIEMISLGFGPTIWRTEYGVALHLKLLPIIGYVKHHDLTSHSKAIVNPMVLLSMLALSSVMIGVAPAWKVVVVTWTELFSGVLNLSLEGAINQLTETIAATPFLQFAAMMIAGTAAINAIPLMMFNGGAALIELYEVVTGRDLPGSIWKPYFICSLVTILLVLVLTAIAVVA